MSESKIIENFIDDPVPLSLFSNPDNPWPDFLALFHLLLIKHGEKKFHLVHNDLEYFESLCNLAKSLDLSWKIVHGKSFHNFEKSTELPEIIKNGVTGELINATDEVSISASKGSVPLPEFVVNPVTKDLQTPRQINSSLLAERILKLSSNPDKLKYYANGLHNRVMSNFCIEKYAKKLNTIYCRIDGNLSQGC